MGVEQLSLGTAQLGMQYGIAGAARLPSAARARAVLSRALELGIRAFDTAPAYGIAEQRLGDFLAGAFRARVAVCTKLPTLAAVETRGIARQVERSLEGSLRRLRTDHVDVYLLHDAGDLARHGRALVDALERERERGRLRRAGISAYSPAELNVLRRHAELGVVQHPFNLLDHRLLGAAARRSLESVDEVQVRSVLLQGLLTMDSDMLPRPVADTAGTLAALHRLLAAHGTRALEVALPFAFLSGAQRVVIGAENASQLESLVESAGRLLPSALERALFAAFGDTPARVIDPRLWVARRSKDVAAGARDDLDDSGCVGVAKPGVKRN